jgi:hypothetical protein
MKNSTIIKGLGYLIDMLEIKIQPNLYKQMPSLTSSGYSWHDTHLTVTRKIKKVKLKVEIICKH